MTENMIAYLIWLACALLLVGLGCYDLINAGKGRVFGFYANAQPPKAEQLTDVTAYNRAIGKLFIGSGLVFALLGLPLLSDGGNSGLMVLFTILGSVFWVIGMVLIYVLKIEKQYRKKGR